jgi:hypothetical protein
LYLIFSLVVLEIFFPTLCGPQCYFYVDELMSGNFDLPPEHVPHLELEFCHFYVFQCSHASGAGGRYFNELCGLNVLYSSRHSSINTWASFKV